MINTLTRPFISLLVLIFLCFAEHAFAQDYNARAAAYQAQADSLSEHKQYRKAAQAYLQESRSRLMLPYKKNAAVNAGYCYAQTAMADSALYCFTKAVNEYGFRNSEWLATENTLTEMRKLPGYTSLKEYLARMHEKELDPSKAQIITRDIDLFWKVYDRYLKDTTHAELRFLKEYIERGSPGLQEYYRVKTPNIGGMKAFVRNMATMRKYYASIRPNLSRTKGLTDTFRVIFSQLKTWYPPAVFPNTIFLVGGWSSGGTSTDYGAIVGADMQSADSKTVTTELNAWQKRNLIDFSGMKHVVAHELIHVQQSRMKEDTTLLSYAIKEGMADFIGELISGKTANQRLPVFAKGKEQQIWNEFKKEMYLNRYSNWIANSKSETPERPADLGYWVGYQICKAYFKQAADKKKAVDDMLSIQDYKAFLEKSGMEDGLLKKM